jgi:hypothetical protein
VILLETETFRPTATCTSLHRALNLDERPETSWWSLLHIFFLKWKNLQTCTQIPTKMPFNQVSIICNVENKIKTLNFLYPAATSTGGYLGSPATFLKPLFLALNPSSNFISPYKLRILLHLTHLKFSNSRRKN